MKILGISCYFHDAAAALLHDGWLIAAKEQRRRKLAALSFSEKVRVVVQMQQMAAPVLRARGRPVRVWVLDDLKPVDRK